MNVYIKNETDEQNKFAFSSRSFRILHNKSKIPFCKSKLLELIHLSLLMSGSKLQLSDLLR